MDEIGLIIKQWNHMHNPHANDDEPEQVDAMTFMGDGGEWL